MISVGAAALWGYWNPQPGLNLNLCWLTTAAGAEVNSVSFRRQLEKHKSGFSNHISDQIFQSLLPSQATMSLQTGPRSYSRDDSVELLRRKLPWS